MPSLLARNATVLVTMDDAVFKLDDMLKLSLIEKPAEKFIFLC